MIDYIELPSFIEYITYLPLFVLLVFAVGYIAGTLKISYAWKTNYTRKVVHFSLYFFGWIFVITLPFRIVEIYGGAIGIIGLGALIWGNGNRIYESIAREQDEPLRWLYLLIPYLSSAVGSVIAYFFWPETWLVGLVCTGVGDAVGEPFGVRFGKHKYRVPTITGIVSYRSLEGSAAVIFMSTLGSIIALSIGFDFLLSIIVSIFVGLSVGFVEALSPHGLDNLTITLTASVVANILVNAFVFI